MIDLEILKDKVIRLHRGEEVTDIKIISSNISNKTLRRYYNTIEYKGEMFKVLENFEIVKIENLD